MPLKLGAKAVFKVCVLPAGGRGRLHWGGALVQVCDGPGLEAGGDQHVVLLSVNQLQVVRAHTMCSINVSHSYDCSFMKGKELGWVFQILPSPLYRG